MIPAKRTTDSTRTSADREHKFLAPFDRLRLIAEGIGRPSFPVVAALEFDFKARMRHHRKKSIAVGNPKWIQRTTGLSGSGRFGTNIHSSCSVVA